MLISSVSLLHISRSSPSMRSMWSVSISSTMSYDMVEDMLTDHIDLMEGDDLEICNKDTELISI